MKKIIFTLLMTLLLSLSLSFGAVASAEGVSESAAETLAEQHAASVEDGEGATAADVFNAVFEVVGKYSGEILSALAFLGSAIVALTYKKGLFPILKSGVGRLSDAVDKIQENVAKESTNSSKSIENVNNYVQMISDSTERLEESILNFEKRIKEVEEEKMRNEAFSLLLNEQIELLSDVFLSSSLPQYRKELVSERTAKMKKQLKALAGVGDNGSEKGE